MNGNAIVIDNGTSKTRVGLGGFDQPIDVFPSIVGRPKQYFLLDQIYNANYSGIESFGGHFMDCTNLKSISAPMLKNVTSFMFSGCTSLSSINMENVNDIGEKAFEDCSELLSLNHFLSCLYWKTAP